MYVPVAKFALNVRVVEGGKVLEHWSGPGEQSGMAPFPSTSTKNLCEIPSPLESDTVTESPRRTVIVGLEEEVLFQPETMPSSARVRAAGAESANVQLNV